MKTTGRAFAAIMGLVVLFQVALILGAPWGHLTLGGQWSGALPLKIRLIPAVSIILLLAMTRIALGDSGLRPQWGPRWLIWPVCAYMALGIAVHIVTPSAAERMLWLPVLTVLFGLSLRLALSPRPVPRAP
ncbi:hypothetical protein [Caulobacter henricii]|uniref:DoxX family protein n=1 Tax=Caulobacter henricii TaxID=69395 RepID=A0A0P0P1G6_9CAUL|nr:hypothetical protein [Caulobacter henricii]ALL14336.1 hypothetical protein AQ619_13830 [Caulobacter henricii]